MWVRRPRVTPSRLHPSRDAAPACSGKRRSPSRRSQCCARWCYPSLLRWPSPMTAPTAPRLWRWPKDSSW